jgi:ATP synthase protein I
MTNGDAGDAKDPLRELQRRIDGAQRAHDATQRERAPREDAKPLGSALALAWRIGLELVVAILVATALGWAIDRWLGTRPWGMLVMFFLGVAAGMVNVWRAVSGMGMAVGYRPPDKTGAAKDQGEDED